MSKCICYSADITFFSDGRKQVVFLYFWHFSFIDFSFALLHYSLRDIVLLYINYYLTFLNLYNYIKNFVTDLSKEDSVAFSFENIIIPNKYILRNNNQLNPTLIIELYQGYI